jgi:hypothetical protein
MRKYNEALVKRHGFEEAHRASAPGKPHTILSEADCAKEDGECPPNCYRSKIGGALRLCRVALPIIAYQVCALVRFDHAPGKAH